jgi:hypothetical protein
MSKILSRFLLFEEERIIFPSLHEKTEKEREKEKEKKLESNKHSMYDPSCLFTMNELGINIHSKKQIRQTKMITRSP